MPGIDFIRKLAVALILLVCPVAIIYGQARPAAPDSLLQTTYLAYYRAVAKAEEAVIQGRYPDGIAQYQRAFGAYAYNNPLDCYIAAQAAAYLDDTVACSSFLLKGLCFGLPRETIASNPHLAPFLATMAPRRIDSCRDIYSDRIDRKAREAVLSLARCDQAFIHSPQSRRIYEVSGHALRKPYRPFWDSLMGQVVAIIKEKGFPAEKLIGTQHAADSLFAAGPQSTFVYFIMVHHCNAWSLIGDRLYDELLKGNITPQMYGALYEHSSGRDFYDNPVHYFSLRECTDKGYNRRLQQTGLKQVNEARWQIGLGSYEVMQQKHRSEQQYRQWRREKVRKKEPFFDFRSDLHFQGA